MKRMIIAIVTAVLCAALCAAALAEAPQTPSPVYRLYQAEQALLFSTDNVTMTGHAVFSADGSVFKTADLLHIQSGRDAVRDWRLRTPAFKGGNQETGYTVVSKGESIDAFESYHHGHKRYGVEPSWQRTSILRHTVASETLAELAGLLVAQCGDIGQCTAEANADGTTTLAIRLTRDDVPPVLDALLNSVLQFGVTRYTYHDYAVDGVYIDANYQNYNTIAEGLVICLKSVRLRELTATAVLDDKDRLRSVSGVLVLDYEDKMGEDVSELRLEFEQTASDYGVSRVNNDPRSYDHWETADEADAQADDVSQDDRCAEEAAVQRLLQGLYWNPKGGSRLHADWNCPSVNSRYLPMDRADLTADLLLEYSLCAVCVDASPFINEADEASLDVAAADLIAALTYDADYGLNELFWDLDVRHGLFSSWSYVQKHHFTAMLPALAQREVERMEQYHPNWLADIRLRDMLCIWSYGLPEEGADGAAMDAAEAYALANGLLTQEQLNTLTVTCDYYTGSSFVLPFSEPWWVIRYSDRALPVCEIWLNSALSSIHGVNVQRMKDIAQSALMAEKPVMGETPVTQEALQAFETHVIYMAEDQQWDCVFDSGVGSCWHVFMQDDADLSVAEMDASNG